ncbi:hypothetical protein Tco_0440163 [Tanacetum coccineum]
MSDSEHSTVTYTSVSEDDSDIGLPGAEGPIFQDPPSPDYVPGPQEPEQHPFTYLCTIVDGGSKPMPAADSPTHQSPGYIPESDPEEDPEEDDEEDPADYPADRGDDRDDEESSDDDDDAEEEEHLGSFADLQLLHIRASRRSHNDPIHLEGVNQRVSELVPTVDQEDENHIFSAGLMHTQPLLREEEDRDDLVPLGHSQWMLAIRVHSEGYHSDRSGSAVEISECRQADRRETVGDLRIVTSRLSETETVSGGTKDSKEPQDSDDRASED